jgi:hypothetical protein
MQRRPNVHILHPSHLGALERVRSVSSGFLLPGPLVRISGVVISTLQTGVLLRTSLTSPQYGWLASAYGAIFSSWSSNITRCFLVVHNGMSPWSALVPTVGLQNCLGKKQQSEYTTLGNFSNFDCGVTDFYLSQNWHLIALASGYASGKWSENETQLHHCFP